MSNSVLVLGGSGMLGAMVVDYLSRQNDLNVVATVRTNRQQVSAQAQYPTVAWRLFDAEQVDSADTAKVLDGVQWIINAIGITKPLIRDDHPMEIERAIRVNSLFPQWLGKEAGARNQRVLQIATDCVYSGAKGAYTERDVHDALDVYGKSKSLGEAYHPAVHNLRCSIIGVEPRDHKFLVDWVLGQAAGAKLSGFVNHVWNGVTTLQFAKLCHGVMRTNLPLGHMQHVIPTAEVTKCELLEIISQAYGRNDLTINPTEAKTVVNRTLQTVNAELNSTLWREAGYSIPPTVAEMVREMARWQPAFERKLAA